MHTYLPLITNNMIKFIIRKDYISYKIQKKIVAILVKYLNSCKLFELSNLIFKINQLSLN